jgi:hypothetical protein
MYWLPTIFFAPLNIQQGSAAHAVLMKGGTIIEEEK